MHLEKICHITVLDFFLNSSEKVQDSDLAWFFEDGTKVKDFFRLSHLYKQQKLNSPVKSFLLVAF